MTEFEQAVRAAMGLLRDDRGNEVLDQLAPRVAVAIHAAASYSDSSRPEIEQFALGALRGVPK